MDLLTQLTGEKTYKAYWYYKGELIDIGSTYHVQWAEAFPQKLGLPEDCELSGDELMKAAFKNGAIQVRKVVMNNHLEIVCYDLHRDSNKLIALLENEPQLSRNTDSYYICYYGFDPDEDGEDGVIFASSKTEAENELLFK